MTQIKQHTSCCWPSSQIMRPGPLNLPLSRLALICATCYPPNTWPQFLVTHQLSIDQWQDASTLDALCALIFNCWCYYSADVMSVVKPMCNFHWATSNSDKNYDIKFAFPMPFNEHSIAQGDSSPSVDHTMSPTTTKAKYKNTSVSPKTTLRCMILNCHKANRQVTFHEWQLTGLKMQTDLYLL